MSATTTALVLAWGVILLLAFALAGLLRQVSALTAVVGSGQGPGLSERSNLVGAVAPPTLAGLRGENKSAAHAFVFSDRACLGCKALLAGINAGHEIDRSRTTFIYPSEAGSGSAQLETRVIEKRQDLFSQLGVEVTPHAIVVDAEGTVLVDQPVGSYEEFLEASQTHLSNSEGQQYERV